MHHTIWDRWSILDLIQIGWLSGTSSVEDKNSRRSIIIITRCQHRFAVGAKHCTLNEVLMSSENRHFSAGFGFPDACGVIVRARRGNEVAVTAEGYTPNPVRVTS